MGYKFMNTNSLLSLKRSTMIGFIRPLALFSTCPWHVKHFLHGSGFAQTYISYLDSSCSQASCPYIYRSDMLINHLCGYLKCSYLFVVLTLINIYISIYIYTHSGTKIGWCGGGVCGAVIYCAMSPTQLFLYLYVWICSSY